jgi:hypothetical protein
MLIFDNADDIDLESTGGPSPWMAGLIRSLLQSELGSIVFTTTNRGVAEVLAPRRVIELGGISLVSG